MPDTRDNAIRKWGAGFAIFGLSAALTFGLSLYLFHEFYADDEVITPGHPAIAGGGYPTKKALARYLNQQALQCITGIKGELALLGHDHPAFRAIADTQINTSEAKGENVDCRLSYEYKVKLVRFDDPDQQLAAMTMPEDDGVRLDIGIEPRWFKTSVTRTYSLTSPEFTASEFRGQFTAYSLLQALAADGIPVIGRDTELETLNELLFPQDLAPRFKNVRLPKAAKYIKTNQPVGRETLNRLILEAAYPDKCPRNRLMLLNVGRETEAYYYLLLGKNVKALEVPVTAIIEEHLKYLRDQVEKMR